MKMFVARGYGQLSGVRLIKQPVDDDREVIGMARNQCSALGIRDRGARAELLNSVGPTASEQSRRRLAGTVLTFLDLGEIAAAKGHAI
jgi:hypothetical protein